VRVSDPVTLLDPDKDARGVLQAMVADLGPQILSDASTVEGICEDRLADRPREARLLVVAAQSDVAAMLAQQVPAAGPDAAVRMTASMLSESQSIEPWASLWVTAEFARALGHPVSDGLAPIDGAGGPAGVPTGGSAGAARADGETLLPDAGAGAAAGGGAAVGVAGAKTGQSLPKWLPAAIAVPLVAAVYLGAAAAAKLPPFAKASSTTTTTTTLAGGTTVPTEPTVPGARSQLQGMIPAAVTSAGTCKPVPHPSFGASAAINCTPSSGLVPADYIGYYLFPDQSTLTNAYSYFLANFAKTTSGGTSCAPSGSFSGFVPGCETGWNNPSASGRMTEYEFHGNPDLTTTVTQQDVLVDMSGTDGPSLVSWWALDPTPWLVTGAGTGTTGATGGTGGPTGGTGAAGIGTTGSGNTG
jgi:hypothetical protein